MSFRSIESAGGSLRKSENETMSDSGFSRKSLANFRSASRLFLGGYDLYEVRVLMFSGLTPEFSAFVFQATITSPLNRSSSITSTSTNSP